MPNLWGYKKPRHLRRTLGVIFIMLTGFYLFCQPPTALANKAGETENKGGALQRGLSSHRELITVKLRGVTRYEVTELFNHLLESTPGVVEARRYHLLIQPDRPAACIIMWRVQIDGSSAFQIESELLKKIRNTNSSDILPGFAFDVTSQDIEMLRKIQPWLASSNEIQFVVYDHTGFKTKSAWRNKTPWNDYCSWPDSGFE